MNHDLPQANHFRFRQVGKCSKVIKRYHAPLTPYQRALAHAKVTAAVKRRLRGSVSLAPSGRAHGRVSHKPRGTWQLRRSSCRTGARPATRLHELRAGNRSDVRQETLRSTVTAGEARATHRGCAVGLTRPGCAWPSKLDPRITRIEGWLVEEPQLTALAITHVRPPGPELTARALPSSFFKAFSRQESGVIFPSHGVGSARPGAFPGPRQEPRRPPATVLRSGFPEGR